ncbi:hypothetical protein ACQ5SO_09620 [Rhodovulum sp. DZ06]|uniref:hypothetical protein n=1 Tax=Rhodovulum sp. DZ06 TaxID=3425126 RepID=UPI003D35245A
MRHALVIAGLAAALAGGPGLAADAPPAAGGGGAGGGNGWTAPPPAEGHSYPDCYCTNRGARVEMGALSCLRVGGEEFTARCGMSLNNPAWRRVRDGCDPGPTALLSPRR